MQPLSCFFEVRLWCLQPGCSAFFYCFKDMIKNILIICSIVVWHLLIYLIFKGDSWEKSSKISYKEKILMQKEFDLCEEYRPKNATCIYNSDTWRYNNICNFWFERIWKSCLNESWKIKLKKLTDRMIESPSKQPSNFYWYECLWDCAWHEAWYTRAENNWISHSDDCWWNSNSFVEWCHAYTEEYNSI